MNHKNKNISSNPSYLKNSGTNANTIYSINKSANFVGKSRQKSNIKKKDNHKNTKSLQYISYSNNNNSSTNYSIGVSINLKANTSVKSNGIINCLNPEQVSLFQVNENKNIIKNNKKIRKNKNDNSSNNLYNIFNNIDILSLNMHERAKSNYNLNYKKEKIIPKKPNTNSENKYKSKHCSVYKKDFKNRQNLFFTTVKQKKNKVISRRKNDLYYSSNSIFSNLNNNNIERLYVKSLGLSFGSNENNTSDHNMNIVFNSISNINKSNSNLSNNLSNTNSNYSPYKFNKSHYHNRNKQNMNNKMNNLMSMVNNKKKNKNISHEFYYTGNNNNCTNLKNKCINCFNWTSYIDNFKRKKVKIADSNKSINF